ncbi:MAG TPA: ATP synthase F1 subunit delta [Flavobacteriaceae bacterium]|nr:ATP synthase F1 subunit delta [Flavobacteriaceae bacterium]
MTGNRAAIRYAKAVLELASERNSLTAVRDEMLTIKESLQQSVELQTVIKSPVVSPEQKNDALLAVFTNTSPLTQNLFNVLMDNKRIDLLESIAENFVRMYNQKEGVVEAKVTTAVEMNSDLEAKVLEKIKSITKAENVSMVNIVDPEIIGGFVLRVGDMQYDASIANSFIRLKKQFNSSI